MNVRFSLAIMLFGMRFLALCFLIFFSGVKDTSAVRLREGQHGAFSRVVLEGTGPLRLVSKKMLDGKRASLVLKGQSCQDLQKTSRVRSTIIQSWKVSSQGRNQCRVTFQFQRPFDIKKVFVLQKPTRLVLDLAPKEPELIPSKQVPVAAMDAPVRMVEPPHKPAFSAVTLSLDVKEKVTPKAFLIQLESWQQEPPEKPTTYLFHPLLLGKPLRPTIVIDPGHGGHDPGSISCRGYYEKHVALQAAKVIAAELKKVGRYHVVLTRKRDKYVPLRKRFSKARAAKADFLLSIHADSHPSKQVRGLSIYTLSARASDREAARLARQENKSEFLNELDFVAPEMPEVSNVLIDIAQRSSSNSALTLAKIFHGDLSKRKVGRVRSLRSAGFTVLKAPDTPSILVELGYLSNEKDEKLVRTSSYQKKLAQSLINALDSYFEKS